MSDDTNACKQWLNEVNWDMIHEDAVTLYLEWGNNNYRDAMRSPVTTSGEYSVYFALDTWAEPKVVLMRMNNYGSTVLCSKKIPEDLARQLLDDIKGIKGILELTPPIKEWLMKELEA
ncbi:DVU0772 family protein [Pseudodesulfovibrio methanolicus]|uniref:DVU0772 family protein n=1 Tax=Pseudodesulfovibrio methanolicus TaxID=3126690 RepID=A0ABZ2J2W8_9BACT